MVSLGRALDWAADNAGNALFLAYAAVAVAGLGLAVVVIVAALV